MVLSPAVVSNGLASRGGVTGSGPDGAMPADPDAQVRAAFAKTGAVLGAAENSFAALVEMTRCHVGLHRHLDLFRAVRARLVAAPFPARTAVEVAGSRREGALVGIRAIAGVGGRA